MTDLLSQIEAAAALQAKIQHDPSHLQVGLQEFRRAAMSLPLSAIAEELRRLREIEKAAKELRRLQELPSDTGDINEVLEPISRAYTDLDTALAAKESAND